MAEIVNTYDEAPQEGQLTNEDSSQVTEETTDSRPDWLPEKFQSPEAMAEAYAELERKQSSGDSGDTNSEASQSSQEAISPELIADYAEKWSSQENSFTEQQYVELEKAGLPRNIVDQFIQGQQAVLQQSVNELVSQVGGADTYQKMAEWAQSTLSPAQIEAYDKALDQGPEVAKLAVQGLHAQYVKAVGKSPALIQGSQNQAGSGAFQSFAEVKAAMKDPRYTKDPAYRDSVAQKLSVSKL